MTSSPKAPSRWPKWRKCWNTAIPAEPARKNPATDLVSLMLQSDIVEFVVGTRINEAHQDPNIPVELDLRRNIVRKIASLLETRHLKEARIQFI